jgi:hypothetical protein
LKNLGVIPPPTYGAAHSLLAFITEGNGTIGGTIEERVALVIAAQKKWVGHRVCVQGQRHRIGRVRYLYAEPGGAITNLRAINQKRINPFNAIVDWEKPDPSRRMAATMALNSLRRVREKPENEQPAQTEEEAEEGAE